MCLCVCVCVVRLNMSTGMSGGGFFRLNMCVLLCRCVAQMCCEAESGVTGVEECAQQGVCVCLCVDCFKWRRDVLRQNLFVGLGSGIRPPERRSPPQSQPARRAAWSDSAVSARHKHPSARISGQLLSFLPL